MSKKLLLQRQLKRWYPLIDHPEQLRLVQAVANGIRFPVVPAGRRSGKTERAKRFTVKQAQRVPGQYFLAAPTREQAKKIFWDDIKKLSLSVIHTKEPLETELKVFLPIPGGFESEIQVIGLDKPERFEGVPWKGGVIDEIANIKADALNENIFPALNTFNPEDPDYLPWCWFIGVPEGLNHYYDLSQYAQTSGDTEFALFHWVSADILPPETIERAKKLLSKKQFKQEFEASFETASGRIYEDYSSANTTNRELSPEDQILWCHDFNFTPMSSAVCIRENENIFIVDEIVLESAVARQSAQEFVDRFKDHKNRHVLIYGDPAGKAGEKHGHRSDYNEIEAVLRENGWTFTRKVQTAHPAIRDRQNAVRAKIRNAKDEISLFVNANTAKYSHKGLATVQVKKGSTFLEEDSEYQHITTAIGYMIAYEFPTTAEHIIQVKIGGM